MTTVPPYPNPLPRGERKLSRPLLIIAASWLQNERYFHSKPPAGEKMIDVSLHHAGLSQRSVGPAHHVFGRFFGALAPRFDFHGVAVKIFEVVVHLFKIGASRFFALHCRSMSRHELLIMALKERFERREPVGDIVEEGNEI